MNKAKSFKISKHAVMEAFRKVKANGGAAGVDGQSIEKFEVDLKDNLYKIWNRMSSGTYFPPAVKAVAISKKGGGERILGVPTVADRVAQMVVKNELEPLVDPYFHEDSYGYRKGKSAIQAIKVTRKRCWRYNWVLEFDIKGLFDNLRHDLLLKAINKHTDCPWVILYLKRWLTAPFQNVDGEITERTLGTPQGSIVGPILANLFLHYTFDLWMTRNVPSTPWVRYADDGLAHCHSREEAEGLLKQLKVRFAECGLELHPDKTRIVYCQDSVRREKDSAIKFDFLGYTFRPRRAKSRYGKFFVSFLPAMSNKAKKSIHQRIHDWRLHLKPGKSLEDFSRMFNPIIRGWINYYGCFYRSQVHTALRYLNNALVLWVRRKFKRFNNHRRRAEYWLGRIARKEPHLFAHWSMGVLPTAG